MRKALVQNGVVSNVAVFPDLAPDWATDWIDCGNDVGPGWLYDGTNFSAPVADLTAIRATTRIPRKDFARAVAAAGHITYAEAADYANGIALPTAVEAFVVTQSSADVLRYDLLTEDEIWRNGEFIPAIAWIYSITSDVDIDALFGIT